MESRNGTEISDAFMMFNWIEYTVFSSMLILSALIGFYYACVKQQNTVSEYMLGGKTMGVFPVTMSLVASHVSGVTLLGVPSEIYTYGTQYIGSALAVIVSGILSITAIIPVFYKLQLKSPYEYFELRFNYNCRMLASFIFAISLIFLTPVIIYVPALAFNQVTGISIHLITPIVCLICIFYTSFGGLKAVVWTDTLQSVFTSVAILFIIIVGCINYGGIAEVLRISQEGHRLELFNMNPSIFERNTFWTTVIGYSFQWFGAIAFHPGVLQRQITVSTYEKSQRVLVYSMIGFFFIKVLCTFVGLLVYAKFHDCDPVATGVIKKPGQILPYYVLTFAGQYPGITGLFISGIVSSALSTMSAGLNTVAGTLYEDFAYIFLKGRKLSDTKASFVMKMIVIVLGTICIFLIYIVDKFDSILQIVVSITGITFGALVSMFLLGLFVPWANAKGAIFGAVASFLATSFISYGGQMAIAQGKLKFPGRVTSIYNCPFNITVANASSRVQTNSEYMPQVIASEDVLQIFKISYSYYCVVGVLLGILVGTLVSLITGKQDLATLNPDLVAPVMRRFLPAKPEVAQSPEQDTLLRPSNGAIELTAKHSGNNSSNHS